MSRDKEIIRRLQRTESTFAKHSMNQKTLGMCIHGERKLGNLYNPCRKTRKAERKDMPPQDTDSLI
mgnify:CR=1 FL=1